MIRSASPKNFGLKPIIRSFPNLVIARRASIVPKAECIFNSISSSVKFKIKGFLSFSRTRMLARSIASIKHDVVGAEENLYLRVVVTV